MEFSGNTQWPNSDESNHMWAVEMSDPYDGCLYGIGKHPVDAVAAFQVLYSLDLRYTEILKLLEGSDIFVPKMSGRFRLSKMYYDRDKLENNNG